MITPTSWPFSSYWNCAENSCCSIFIVLSIFLFLILGVERSASASIEILCCDKEYQWFCVIHLESSLHWRENCTSEVSQNYTWYENRDISIYEQDISTFSPFLGLCETAGVSDHTPSASSALSASPVFCWIKPSNRQYFIEIWFDSMKWVKPLTCDHCWSYSSGELSIKWHSPLH